MTHVLVGEINVTGNVTGYHTEFAADGAARIKPGADITFSVTGTYEAPVQIWNAERGVWVDKVRASTFFPPRGRGRELSTRCRRRLKACRCSTLGGGEGNRRADCLSKGSPLQREQLSTLSIRISDEFHFASHHGRTCGRCRPKDDVAGKVA